MPLKSVRKYIGSEVRFEFRKEFGQIISYIDFPKRKSSIKKIIFPFGVQPLFINNVRQEPTAAYTASGTTLDFGSGNAPATNAEIEVKHLGLRTTARRAVSMFLDNITGNGSATAFTLSNSASVNDVFVFYNGVCMKPTTDYGISGATLTFTFTPVNNSQIMARYFV